MGSARREGQYGKKVKGGRGLVWGEGEGWERVKGGKG